MDRTRTSIVSGMFCIAGLLGAAVAHGQAEPNHPAAIVGAWAVQVTLRDCATGAALPGPPVNALVSFHKGGTISESAGSLAFASGQRSAGHGTWVRSGGRTFLQKMIALVLFDTAPNLPGPGFDPTKPVTPGFFGGWQTVSHTVELIDADHLTSAGTNAFYKTNGELYRTGCSTAVGERFK